MSPDTPATSLERARAAARAHADAADAVAQLVDRLDPPAGAAELTEYATLLSREESTLRQRRDALGALGLDVPTISEDDGSSER